MKLTQTSGPYASWRDETTGRTVEYSLPLLHEIEALVSEHFRRVPQGGMEVGGLLLGEQAAARVRVDGFTPIECSHAAGPAFVLTDAEVDKLTKQIQKQGDHVVGWFISHARGQLTLSDWEAGFVRMLFPAGAITVVVKPEASEPTRFAIFTSIEERDGLERAFLLPPLAGSARPEDSRALRSGKSDVRSLPDRGGPAATIPRVADDRGTVARPLETRAAPPIEPAASSRRPLTEALSRPEEESPAEEVRWSFGTAGEGARIVGGETPRQSGLTWLLAGAAVAFSLLALYGLYRAAVPGEVPLQVSAHGDEMVVSWPAEQSRRAEQAAVRVNDGDAQPLSNTDKDAGTTTIRSTADTVKVELILSRWGRETHSVDRYLRTAKTAVKSASRSLASGTAAPAP